MVGGRRTGGCFRLADTKEGASVRPIGRRAFELLATFRGSKAAPLSSRRCAATGISAAFRTPSGAWRSAPA